MLKAGGNCPVADNMKERKAKSVSLNIFPAEERNLL
jgi:hypothetical protein